MRSNISISNFYQNIIYTFSFSDVDWIDLEFYVASTIKVARD